jgi:hypothetical protein
MVARARRLRAGDVGNARWPAARFTSKPVSNPRSMVVEVHPKYYVVTAISADDQPILFKGKVRSWRVDHDQFCLSIRSIRSSPDL